MTFEQIRTFLVVAESGSFTRAAERLFMSQPGVSHHVQALERDVGHRLFDRRGRTLDVTPAGARFLDYARRIVHETDSLSADLRSLDDPLQGTVLVGAIHSVGLYVLPAFAIAFAERHPGIHIRAIIGNTERVTEALMQGGADLAVLDAELPGARGFVSTPLDAEEWALIVPPGHPWANREDVSPAELRQSPLVMRVRGTRSRAVLDGELAKSGVDLAELDVGLELDSHEAIKQAVSAGLGVGFVPGCMVRREMSWGVLAIAKLATGPLMRQLWLCEPARKTLAPRVALVRDALRQR